MILGNVVGSLGITEKLLAKRLAPKQSRMSIYGVVDAIYSNYV